MKKIIIILDFSFIIVKSERLQKAAEYYNLPQKEFSAEVKIRLMILNSVFKNLKINYLRLQASATQSFCFLESNTYMPQRVS